MNRIYITHTRTSTYIARYFIPSTQSMAESGLAWLHQNVKHNSFTVWHPAALENSGKRHKKLNAKKTARRPSLPTAAITSPSSNLHVFTKHQVRARKNNINWLWMWIPQVSQRASEIVRNPRDCLSRYVFIAMKDFDWNCDKRFVNDRWGETRYTHSHEICKSEKLTDSSFAPSFF